VRLSLPLLRGKTGRAFINLCKDENDDIDALKAICMFNKKFLIVTRVPKITARVAAFDANTFNDRELLKRYLAIGNRIINFCMQTNRKRLFENMVAHVCHPKKCLLLVFFWKKNKKDFKYKAILLSFRKHFHLTNVF